MGKKGTDTKELIKAKAYDLFAYKGFSKVTMKDICEVTGLSRGGLYRHYESPRQVFEEIFEDLSEHQVIDIQKKMEQNISALIILNEMLEQLRDEMLSDEKSLSLAIYEYSNICDKSFFEKRNSQGREKWSSLIGYGIERKEFAEVDVNQVLDMLLYSYQGVRMWSRVISVGEETVDHIVTGIREMLVERSKEK